MRREFRRGLKRALKSSGAASLETIIFEINRESHQFTLKEVLRELQDAVEERVLKMDGDKFRLTGKGEAIGDCNPSDDDSKESSESFSDENESIGDCKGQDIPRDRKRKIDGKKQKKMGGKRLHKKTESDDREDYHSDFLESDSHLLKSAKVDLRRRRGPRCTSMKKEMKIPSRVHIPWTPRTEPGRSQAHNDLLRKSPDPMVGPLFDDVFFMQPPDEDLLCSPVDPLFL